MTTLTTPSPLPWETLADGGVTIISYPFQVIASEICGATTEAAVANAAFIVQAVNSHAALVEALMAILQEVDNPELPFHISPGAFEKARLALAEGRP